MMEPKQEAEVKEEVRMGKKLVLSFGFFKLNLRMDKAACPVVRFFKLNSCLGEAGRQDGR